MVEFSLPQNSKVMEGIDHPSTLESEDPKKLKIKKPSKGQQVHSFYNSDKKKNKNMARNVAMHF